MNTTYTLSGYESVCGTYKTKSITISVGPKVGPVTIGGEPFVCQGTTTTQYVANATNAYSYLWNITPASAGSIDATGLVSWNSSFIGTATVQVTAISPPNCNYTTSDSYPVEVTVPPTTAYAGPDQTGSDNCGLSTVTLSANTPVVGTGSWAKVSGTGGSFGNAASPSSSFTGSPGNAYILRWTISKSTCPASTDDVVIRFNKNPTSAFAGADQTGSSTCGNTSVTLNGNIPETGNGLWTIISGANGNLSNSTSPNSTFGGVAGSTYILRWTISNSPCAASTDDVTIKFNQNPTTANAGPDQMAPNTCQAGSFTLAANTPQIGNGSWSTVSGAGGTFENINDPATEFYAKAGASYVLRWTISNGPCGSSSDDMNVFNPPPVISSEGSAQYLSYGNTIRLSTGCYYSYQWKNNAIDIPGATAKDFFAREPGVYTVVVKGSPTSIGIVSPGFTIYDAIPSQNKNYFSTVTFLKKGVNTTALFTLRPQDYSQSTTYFDGLGRPMQSVVTMGSPTQRDVIQPFVYDEVGREFRKFLPVSLDERTGRYKDNATLLDPLYGKYIGAAASFYDDPASNVAVAEGKQASAMTIFEPSPLNRVWKQGAPGSTWQPSVGDDHAVEMAYKTNDTDEVLLWTYSRPTSDHPLGLVSATSESASTLPISYKANTLFKNITWDEQEHQVIEYKDTEGRIVLKRVQAVEPPLTMGDEDYASTYYIYDAFGQLVCVIPPEAVKRLSTQYYQTGATSDSKDEFLSRWAFRYRYDARRRMIMKQVPGADSTTMVYDQRDRLVMVQDGNLRSADQWLTTKYDELNRPVMTGLYSHGSTINQNQMSQLVNGTETTMSETYNGNASNHGYSNNAFPLSNLDLLTVTYYDDYSFKSLLNNSDFDYHNDELPGSSTFKAQAQEEYSYVRNQVTGMKTKILNSTTWLWTAHYYDDHYRLIQATSSNAKGGFNRLTNVYDFTGNVLRTKSRYTISGQTADSDTKIIQRYSYDHAGRLLKTFHQIEGGPEVVISSNEYNEIGQLVTQRLHQTSLNRTPVAADPLVDQPGTTYDTDIASSHYSASESAYVASNSIRLLPGFTIPLNSTFTARIGYSQEDALAYNNSIEGDFLQTIDYRYNIRGWLTRINDPVDPLSQDLFNLELAYNKPSTNGGEEQFNGNISEAVWKSAGLDKQSYGYDYDPMNRIMKGLYYNLAKPMKNGDYNELIGDPADLGQFPAYDLNGNVQNLRRNGETDAGTYGLMDKLHYDYGGINQSEGNKLMFVSDAQPNTSNEEGFKELGDGTTDYDYDKNGNLIKDENKGIISIEYNHLNLPWKVSKSATEYLVYTYDAAGKKLSQEVFGTTPKTTEYLGDLVFEDNTLQFIIHPEGRVVKDTEVNAPDPWEYQYFLKDHLGNTRVVFSEKTHSTEYRATLEEDRKSEEMATFFQYPESGTRSDVNEFDHTDAGTTYTRSQLLTGADNNRVGLAKSFEVNPGDVFDLEVYAKYLVPSGTPSDVNTILSQLASAFSLGTATSPLDGATAYSAFENVFQGGAPWVNSSMWDEAPPKAYLNYLLFDESFVLIDAGFDQVSTDCQQELDLDPLAAHDHLSLHVKVEQKGYLYVYLSNEQPTLTNVYFDDMKIVRYGAIEQVSDYYPFGLTFNSYARENTIENQYLFAGKERQDELKIGWLAFGARMYQPEIARWNGIDPSSENYVDQSTYHYAGNNPTKFVDFDGNDYGVKIDRGNKTITIEAHFLTSSKSSAAFQQHGSRRWNAQSGRNVFIAGSLKALKQGKADAYTVNINVTSEVSGGEDGQGRYLSDRDEKVNQDQTGTLNSFDVETEGFVEHQGGGTGNDQIDMKAGNEDSSTTTHEVNHAMGIAHTGDGGNQPPHGGGSVGKAQVGETLKGVGIGGNTAGRNSKSGVGDGTLLHNSSNAGLGKGKVISVRRYERIVRRLERREERQNQ